jgi:hypothetical protein
MSMEQRMIYTLIPVKDRWEATMGIRSTEGIHSQNHISLRQSFVNKDEADKWLMDHAKTLKVTFLPKTIPATSVPLPLGGVIPPEG